MAAYITASCQPSTASQGRGIRLWRLATCCHVTSLCACHVHVATLDGCRVQGNQATKSGGGMYAYNTTLVMTRTQVQENHAAAVGGGVDAWTNAKVVLSGGHFARNTAVKDGGGAWVGGTSELRADNVVFHNNTAHRGAGLYAESAGVLRVQRCVLKENHGTGEIPIGGAIALLDTAIGRVTDCLVVNNTAGGAAGLLVSSGPAIAQVSNTTFERNVVTDDGGAIAVSGQGRLQLTNCRLLRNSAGDEGGCLKLEAEADAELVGANHFEGNHANTGGCVCMGLGRPHLNVSGAVFKRNTAVSQGGVLFANSNSQVFMQNSTLKADIDQHSVTGGMLNTDGNASLVLKSCIFSNASASRGGGLACFGDSRVVAHNCTFQGLRTLGYGGALNAAERAQVRWMGGVFVNTHAGWGGAVSAAGDANVTFNGTKFQNCSARDYGGGIQVEDNANLTMLHCELQGCRSLRDNGGAIAASDNTVVSMYSCLLKHNVAKLHAGGIYAVNNASFHMYGSSIVENTCKDAGGGLFCIGKASMVLHDCSVVGNAATKGGGVWVMEECNLSLHDTKIHNNSASWIGGGVALLGNNFDLNQVEAAVTHNKAPVAADKFLWPTNMTIVGHSMFENFVCRVSDDDGRVNATLRLTGPQGLPSEGVTVFASLGVEELHTVVMATNTTAEGVAHMPVKLRQRPGRLGFCCWLVWPASLSGRH